MRRTGCFEVRSVGTIWQTVAFLCIFQLWHGGIDNSAAQINKKSIVRNFQNHGGSTVMRFYWVNSILFWNRTARMSVAVGGDGLGRFTMRDRDAVRLCETCRPRRCTKRCSRQNWPLFSVRVWEFRSPVFFFVKNFESYYIAIRNHGMDLPQAGTNKQFFTTCRDGDYYLQEFFGIFFKFLGKMFARPFSEKPRTDVMPWTHRINMVQYKII